MLTKKTSQVTPSKFNHLEMHGHRKTSIKTNSAAADAMEKHEKYLITIQKQGKYFKAMKENPKARVIEEREKNFSLYVNGANAFPGRTDKNLATPRTGNKSRATTARSTRNQKPSPKDTEQRNIARSKTAPEAQCKYWGQPDLVIKDSKGNLIPVSKEPKVQYSEDFEDSGDADNFDSSDLAASIEEDIRLDEDSDSVGSESYDSFEESVEFNDCDDKPAKSDSEESIVEDLDVSSLSFTDSLPSNNPMFTKPKADPNLVPMISKSKMPSQIENKSSRKRENLLEQSWQALSHFNHVHLGRLHAGDARESLHIQEGFLKHFKPNPGKSSTSAEAIVIPNLPMGQNIVVNIHTTWGDENYVGLCGIEIFSEDGNLVKVSEICSDPSDINILSEYKNDPRVVTNLLNGVNRTCDDINMWLAPFCSGANHFLYLTLSEKSRIAMIRLWNYNKSRIHSCRGVRDISITLDEKSIFCGEIKQASGTIVSGTSSFGDNILFTVEEEILKKISEHDMMFLSN